jgi:hypothetical protein
MKLTPRPFVVRAMITLGWAWTSSALSREPRISETL